MKPYVWEAGTRECLASMLKQLINSQTQSNCFCINCWLISFQLWFVDQTRFIVTGTREQCDCERYEPLYIMLTKDKKKTHPISKVCRCFGLVKLCLTPSVLSLTKWSSRATVF